MWVFCMCTRIIAECLVTCNTSQSKETSQDLGKGSSVSVCCVSKCVPLIKWICIVNEWIYV